jgi:hypothetical protein
LVQKTGAGHEAEQSALAIKAVADRSERRLLPIATGGCWGWSGKVGIKTTATDKQEEEREPLSDLFQITWEPERPAIIVFDSNIDTNARVRTARWTFAQTLVGLGAKVFFVDIHGNGSAKSLDDFIAAAGDKVMLAQLDAARPFAEQAENEAEEALKKLSESSSLQDRDVMLALIAAIPDLSHRSALVARTAKAPQEPTNSVSRAVGSKAKAVRVALERARNHVRLARIKRVKIVPADLIMDLETFYGSERLSLPEGGKTVLALFTLNSYTFDLFDTTPYLQIDSATGGCGKTTLLLHLEVTCNRAYLGADPSEAALFRRIDRDKPTWLLDEAAVLHGHDERANAIRAVLDAGYRKGATVSRCVGENNDLRDFEVFCPKVFGLVGSLRGTTLDRCIIIHMVKTMHTLKTRRRMLYRLAAPLREKLEAYATLYRPQVEKLYDAEPDAGYWPQLTGREEDIWGPLMIHARLAGPEVEKRALDVALSFSGQKAEMAVAEDFDTALTLELKEALEKHNSEYCSPGELVSILAGEESWAEKLAKYRTQKGRVCAIGRFLNRFRLPSRERYRGGTRYKRAEALTVIAYHIPHIPGQYATNATQPVNTLVPEVACGQTENATSANGDAGEGKESAAVATNPDPVAITTAGNATLHSRINTGSVALCNSTQGGREESLKC